MADSKYFVMNLTAFSLASLFTSLFIHFSNIICFVTLQMY